MDCKRKSNFEVLQLKTRLKFKRLDDIKQQVLEDLKDKVSEPLSQIGYIEPGHGLRGKQRWLASDDDLDKMYEMYKKGEITLWCFGGSKEDIRKRTLSEDDANSNKRSRYECHMADKMAEVDKIQDELREKHSGKYSEEQLRSWAHLIQMKKHESLEKAPDKPFWRTKKAADLRRTSSVSPGKRISLRGQCVDQLLKWHELLEKGAITKEQYDDFHATIMEDVKKF